MLYYKILLEANEYQKNKSKEILDYSIIASQIMNWINEIKWSILVDTVYDSFVCVSMK